MQVDATPPLPEQHYSQKLFTLPQSSRPHYQQQRQLADTTFAAAAEEEKTSPKRLSARLFSLPGCQTQPVTRPFPLAGFTNLRVQEKRRRLDEC